MSPAVNLALEEVPFAILEVVKARILANRSKLGAEQDQQKPPPSLKPRPQLRKFGANSKTYRRPEPAATGGGFDSIYGVAYISVGLAIDGTPNTVVRIACGDGSAAIYLNSFDFYHGDPLLLPINSTSAIIAGYSQGIVTCIFVSTTSVQVIHTPNKISNLIEILYRRRPNLDIYGQLEYSYIESYSRTIFERIKFTDILGGFTFYGNLYGEVGLGPSIHIVGPGIFSFLKNPDTAFSFGLDATFNDLYAYAADSPLPKKSVTIFPRFPYVDYLYEYNGPMPPIGDYGPTNDIMDPVWKKSRRPTRTPPFRHDQFPKVSANKGGRLIHFIWWDWGRPNYCREQCLALGFSAADLAP